MNQGRPYYNRQDFPELLDAESNRTPQDYLQPHSSSDSIGEDSPPRRSKWLDLPRNGRSRLPVVSKHCSSGHFRGSPEKA